MHGMLQPEMKGLMRGVPLPKKWRFNAEQRILSLLYLLQRRFHANFREIAKINPNYADILGAEYLFCIKHEKEILKKAMAVYKIGCNKQHKLNYTCCDFKKLEQAYKEYTYKKESSNS